MALKLYTGGALFFGTITAGTVMVYVHSHVKQQSIEIASTPCTPSEILTYDQFCKRNWVSFGSSCAVRIVDRTVSYPSYGMHCVLHGLGHYESMRKGWAGMHYLGFQGAIGMISGVIVGGTWPVSVPLIALEIAEQKYGYKLC